ncbi:CRISPR-associated ring nuclease Csm6 [Pseudoalteromonas sp. JC3]|uniref:CRISPR-associated ring nuclease Csm6 n=1 Tax=Pseudoalteromonas sp. JC3 TaxID=2810196 RepID=UPI0019D0B77A|nr:CRISPR-associated ring nuclease Csm6 [Pseudoalteromonas sp. JC3]MBR8842767.1 TIGR02584 family CRISPR-associated protein [Pseudoalteromonas sp. JC3]WJE10238.1 CRISPR-associated ring nuclease Csm6 [Pseudoalteromonas sp. JC3]
MKQVLLAVIGHAPQVITETIYAAKVQKGVEFSQIKVITTKKGKERAINALFQPQRSGKTILGELYEDYNITPAQFEVDDILVPSVLGKPLEDVRTKSEVSASANFILDEVKRLTTGELPVFTLMAGGRKTMAFHVGYAMTLYGRLEDTLNHVFVSEEFARTNFYYPTLESQFVSDGTGGFPDAKEAEITLSNVPYLQMRESLPQRLFDESLTFNDAVRICDSFHHSVELKINLTHNQIFCSGQEVKLSDKAFAFYWMFIEDFINNKLGFICPAKDEHCKQLALKYINCRLYVARCNTPTFVDFDEAIAYLADEQPIDSMKSTELKSLLRGMSSSFFADRKREIKAALERVLPKTVADHYDIGQVKATKRANATKNVQIQGISLEQEQVKVINPVHIPELPNWPKFVS